MPSGAKNLICHNPFLPPPSPRISGRVSSVNTPILPLFVAPPHTHPCPPLEPDTAHIASSAPPSPPQTPCPHLPALSPRPSASPARVFPFPGMRFPQGGKEKLTVRWGLNLKTLLSLAWCCSQLPRSLWGGKQLSIRTHTHFPASEATSDTCYSWGCFGSDLDSWFHNLSDILLSLSCKSGPTCECLMSHQWTTVFEYFIQSYPFSFFLPFSLVWFLFFFFPPCDIFAGKYIQIIQIRFWSCLIKCIGIIACEYAVGRKGRMLGLYP